MDYSIYALRVGSQISVKESVAEHLGHEQSPQSVRIATIPPIRDGRAMPWAAYFASTREALWWAPRSRMVFRDCWYRGVISGIWPTGWKKFSLIVDD